MSRVAAPRASSCARACSTRTRDLDVADGLPEMPTARSLADVSLTGSPPAAEQKPIGRNTRRGIAADLASLALQAPPPPRALRRDRPLPLTTHEQRATTPQGQREGSDHRRATYSGDFRPARVGRPAKLSRHR